MTGVQPLREYRVTINGVETTAMLNERDAERLGATPLVAQSSRQTSSAATSKASQPANKSHTPENKSTTQQHSQQDR